MQVLRRNIIVNQIAVGFAETVCQFTQPFMLIEFVDALTKVSTVISVAWSVGTYVWFFNVDTTTDDFVNGKAALGQGQYEMNIYNESAYITSGFTNKIYTENVYVI